MIDREHDLPITKQAEVLRISRGSVYYLPRPVPEADLAIMRRLDRLHLEFPFAGSRMLRDLLAAEGCKIGRRHVKTLMKRMGIEALYRRPRTTKPEPGYKIYPYLLRGMQITRPNQVWAMDINSTFRVPLHAVRCSQRPRRYRHRPQHAAPPAPGVHPLPQCHRGAGTGPKVDPRHRRQLRNPQASEGAPEWLARHPRWTFHFTPTSASWLNAVEGFFAKLTKRRLKRGVFLSVVDLQQGYRHQSLRRRTQYQTEALDLDR